MSIVWWWTPPRRPPAPWPPDDRQPVEPRLTFSSWCVLYTGDVRARLVTFLEQAERRLIVAEHVGLLRRRRRAAWDTLEEDLGTRSAYSLGLIKARGKRLRKERT